MKLKPCPFCGKEDAEFTGDGYPHFRRCVWDVKSGEEALEDVLQNDADEEDDLEDYELEDT